MNHGIPVIYYGTEALLKGGKDPLNREVYNPLLKKNKEVIHYIKELNRVRRDY